MTPSPWWRVARLNAHVRPSEGPAVAASAAFLRGRRAEGRPFHTVLIANRGIAAVRVAHAAAELGIRSVAVYDAEALEQIRRFLSFLPSNVEGLPPVATCTDPIDRQEEELLRIVPEDRSPYDMRRLIELVVDRTGGIASHGQGSTFFELGTSSFGREIITGLARLGGQPVGIFANDPRQLGGAMTWQASAKTRRFIELCATFHLPVVTLVDQPGFMVGLDAEKAGTIRFGTAAVLAAQTAPVPWCSVQIRKAYGVAAAAHYGTRGWRRWTSPARRAHPALAQR
uniref:CoA carboxyltransferase C-terminal domain-containing protein n=1 Tax=Alexandrium monilatum TaxID=311494 RepID=A0A7S4S115_9DINO